MVISFVGLLTFSGDQVVAEIAEVDLAVDSLQGVVVAGQRISVGEVGKRRSGLRIHEAQRARRAGVADRARRSGPRSPAPTVGTTDHAEQTDVGDFVTPAVDLVAGWRLGQSYPDCVVDRGLVPQPRAEQRLKQ